MAGVQEDGRAVTGEFCCLLLSPICKEIPHDPDREVCESAGGFAQLWLCESQEMLHDPGTYQEMLHDPGTLRDLKSLSRIDACPQLL